MVTDVEPHIWPAGSTMLPLTITGSGFGIAPTVTIVGAGVLTPNPTVTGSTDTSISTSVSIALDAPDGPATVMVQSHGSGGNGFVQGTPGQASTGSNTTAITALQGQSPYVVLGAGGSGVCNSGTPVTSNQQVVVGQPISFTGCIPSQSLPIVASESWNPGSNFSNQTAIAGFSVTFDGKSQFSETLTQITNTSCSNGAFCDFNKFFFTAQGTYTFNFAYATNNGTVAPPAATITFTVVAPTSGGNGSFISATAGPVTVYGVGSYSYGSGGTNTKPVLANGNNLDTEGITLTVTGHAPSGYSDQGWSFVPLVQQLTYKFISSPSSQPFVVASGLDTAYPYKNYNVSFPDAPSMPLDASHFGSSVFTTVGEEAASQRFTTYLMWDPQIAADGTHNCELASSAQDQSGAISYTPSTCASIPVPIAVENWGFDGDAIKTLDPASVNGPTKSWILQCGTSQTPGAGSVGYPVWSNTVNADQF
jgi:hypothetical protein